MRVWDVPVKLLCNQHLLGCHGELHGIWSIIINGLDGYKAHPETIRWRGKLDALWARHENLVGEMTDRGMNHQSPLNLRAALKIGEARPSLSGELPPDPDPITPVEEQRKMLAERCDDCQGRMEVEA